MRNILSRVFWISHVKFTPTMTSLCLFSNSNHRIGINAFLNKYYFIILIVTVVDPRPHSSIAKREIIFTLFFLVFFFSNNTHYTHSTNVSNFILYSKKYWWRQPADCNYITSNYTTVLHSMPNGSVVFFCSGGCNISRAVRTPIRKPHPIFINLTAYH